tara:strand:- start:54 stop:365 length:312 start_codon:yes stop_codon:yes gene_type:complete
MSVDLRNLNIYPAFHNFTANDSTTTEILLPSPATQISLGSTGKEIFVCRNGATDGGAIPSNKMTVPSSNYVVLRLGRGKNRPDSIFVASKTGNAEISVILEEL